MTSPIDTAALRALWESHDFQSDATILAALPALLDELDRLRASNTAWHSMQVDYEAEIKRLRTVTDAMVDRAASAIHRCPLDDQWYQARSALEAGLANREETPNG